MKQYERYKESGVEWLGRVPEHWEVRMLKTFCDFVNRGTTPDYQNSGYKVVNQATFSKGFFDESDIRYTSLKSTDTRGYLKKGDVLLASTGGGVLGKSFLFQEEGEYIADSHVTILRDLKERFVPSFLMRFLSIHFDLINGILAQGSTNQIELQREWLRYMQFPYPPIQEQQQIAAYLDNVNTKIDKAISQKERVIDLLNERRQIIIQRAVTRGLDPNVPMKDSGVEWIGEIPEHWEVKALKYIVFMQSGETIKPEMFDENGIYPVYGGNGFRGYTNKYTNEGNFVLIGRQGALCGNVNYASGKFFASEHAIVVYPLNEVNIYWLGETIRLADMNRFSQSAAQPGIAVSTIKNIIFPYPSLQEQNKIATYLDHVNAKIDKAIAIKRQESEKLKEYKTVLIDAAVTGKIKIA